MPRQVEAVPHGRLDQPDREKERPRYYAAEQQGPHERGGANSHDRASRFRLSSEGYNRLLSIPGVVRSCATVADFVRTLYHGPSCRDRTPWSGVCCFSWGITPTSEPTRQETGTEDQAKFAHRPFARWGIPLSTEVSPATLSYLEDQAQTLHSAQRPDV